MVACNIRCLLKEKLFVWLQINEKGSFPVNSSQSVQNDEMTTLWQGAHIKFIANHPFMFVVMKNDQMIFIGHYSC